MVFQAEKQDIVLIVMTVSPCILFQYTTKAEVRRPVGFRKAGVKSKNESQVVQKLFTVISF